MTTHRTARTLALGAALALAAPALAQGAGDPAWFREAALVDPASDWGVFFGRLHMALVHFPIGLLVAAGMVQLFAPNREPRPGNSVLVCLGLGAGSAVLAVWTGWLHQEAEPVRSTLAGTVMWHRWFGVAVGVTALLAFLLAVWARKGGGDTIRKLYLLLLTVSVGAVLVNGHLGGALVHGDGYLQGAFGRGGEAEASEGTDRPEGDDPASEEPAAEPEEDASAPETGSVAPLGGGVSYADARAVLEARCTDCHGAETQKAGLRLDTPQELASWPELLSVDDPGASELLHHVRLPLGDEEHMPPDEELSAEELATLVAWVEAGSPGLDRAD